MSRERKLAAQRKYYEKHKEEERERLRLWYEANKETVKEKKRIKSLAKKREKYRLLFEKEDLFRKGEIITKLFPDIPIDQLENHLKSLLQTQGQ